MKSFLLAAAVFAGVIRHPAHQPRCPGRRRGASEATTPSPSRWPRSSRTSRAHRFIRFGMQPGGRFTAENVPLRELLRFAFQVQPFQIEGLPAWANSDRFDVTAKAEGDIPPTQPGQAGPIQFMMRTLLAERFGLVYPQRDPRDADLGARAGAAGRQARAEAREVHHRLPGAVRGAPRRRAGGPAGWTAAPPPLRRKMQCGFRVGPGTISGGAVARRRSWRNSCRRTWAVRRSTRPASPGTTISK